MENGVYVVGSRVDEPVAVFDDLPEHLSGIEDYQKLSDIVWSGKAK